MSMLVTVLCPGGRRQVVKVTPNTSILQVLEEACNKQKLDPKSFDLMHYNRALDLSSSVRFSNLPNRAQLELAPSAESRVDGDVTLATQLTDGSRLVRQYSCNATLWEVLEEQSLPPSPDSQLTPVCIYARREVAGEPALKATSLRSLGLTGGKAIIRYALRPANQDAGSQAHVSTPLVKPAAPAPVSQSEPSAAATDSTPPAASQSAPAVPAASQSAPSVPGASQSAPPIPGASQSAPAVPGASQSAPAVPGASQSQTVVTSSDRGDVTPAGSGPVLAAAAGPAPGDCDVTANSAGSAIPSPPTVPLPPPSPALRRASPVNGRSSAVGGAARTEGAPPASCDGAEDMELGAGAEERILFLGGRRAVAFSLDEAGSGSAQPELPDDFYDVTVEDARRRLTQLREELAAMDGTPLLTSGQREARRQADLLTRLSAHRHSVIRAQFPDRLVLQGVFLSTDTVQTVMDFIAGYLEDPAAKFTLFTTPPKTTLSPCSRLFEAACVPAALVHVMAAGGATVALSSAVASQLSSPAGAAAAIRGQRLDPSLESTDSVRPGGSGSGSAAAPRSKAPRTAAATGGSERSVPKWFKMGQK